MMLRYFWKPFCEVFDFLSATHSRRSSTYSLVSGEKWLICLIFAVCHSANTFFYFSWEDQEPLALKVCAHSSRFPASQLPHSHFYWYRLVYSIDFLDSFGSFSFSSLCLIFIFPCDSSNPWFPVLCLPILPCFLHCFDIYSFRLFFFFSICRWCFPFSPNEILLWSFSLFTLTSSYTHVLTMTIITIILYRSSSSYFFFCTLFGHLLYKSSHHSLNGLSPATTSSRSHSCSPSPLSISLGGPAFLPGFSRPQCENWRWRGRRWRRDNHWSRPQSVFLVTNCRASLSSC